MGYTFGYGSFPYAWFTHKYGVVFRSSRKDLHDSADLLIATDHGIQLTLFGSLVQVPGIFIQSIVGGFCILVGDPIISPELCNRFFEVFLSHTLILQEGGAVISSRQNAQ